MLFTVERLQRVCLKSLKLHSKNIRLVMIFLNVVKNKIPRYSAGVLIKVGFQDNYTDHLTQTRYWNTEAIN